MAPDFPLTSHSTKKPVTTMLTYPWKYTVLHCNHLGNTWKPLVLFTRHFDYCPSASEGNNQSVRSSAPVVSRCFPGGYNVKLYISRCRLAWWLLAFLHSVYLYGYQIWTYHKAHICNLYVFIASLLRLSRWFIRQYLYHMTSTRALDPRIMYHA